MSVNKAIIVGHLGQNPEVTYLEGGTCVAKFSVATSESYKNKNGEKITNTEWHSVVAWRGLAEVIEKYVKKGMQVYIEGRIKTKKYEKDNVTHYNTSIVADKLQMLGSKSGGQEESSQEKVEKIKDDKPVENEEIGDQEFEDLPF